MTNAPIGLVLALMDESSERSGSGSLFETPIERIVREFSPGIRLATVPVVTWWEHANRNDPIWQALSSSRGGGGPSVTTPTSTTASKRSPESRKASKTNSAHGFRKTKGVSARGKCPKGHYWSYKKKKCLKSKFRR